MGVNSAKGNGALAYSLDFQGGTSMNVKFDKDYSIDEMDEEKLMESRREKREAEFKKVIDNFVKKRMY